MGVDLPDGQVNQLVDAIKAKITLDSVDGLLGGPFGQEEMKKGGSKRCSPFLGIFQVSFLGLLLGLDQAVFGGAEVLGVQVCQRVGDGVEQQGIKLLIIGHSITSAITLGHIVQKVNRTICPEICWLR